MKEGVYILKLLNPSIPKAQERITLILRSQKLKSGKFSLHKEFRDGEIIGGRCVRKWRFSKWESAFAGTQNFSRSFHFIFLMKNRGDDATENVNFQRRKQRLQGRKNFQINFDEFLGTSFSGANVGGRCWWIHEIFGGRPCRKQGCKNLRFNFDEFKHLSI